MNPWPFVIAAYVLTLGGAAVLVGWAWRVMLRAELSAKVLPER